MQESFINHDFIVILTNLATVTTTQTGITIAASLVQGNVNAQTGTPVATNVAASGNVNGTQNSTISAFKIQAAKNTTYYARNSFNSANQANLGGGNGGCVVLEVRRV